MPHSSRKQAWLETALVALVFFIQGAYPVPDVNEPNYLGKAIHFWNPHWAAGDFFLETADAHHVFYFTFGWLSLWLTPDALAWSGRVLTWSLLAWAWRRLSWAVVPRPWLSVLSAALFVACLDRFDMAGEWVIGGVEAKGFAYVLVLLALEAMARGRWNRTWLMLGAASAFHVLIGGWAVVAAGVAWSVGRIGAARRRNEPSPPAPLPQACEGSSGQSSPPAALPQAGGGSGIQASLVQDGGEEPKLTAMLPGLIGGGLLALLGLVPVLMLNRGVEPAVVREASEIYVYERLYHHLDPLEIPPPFVFRFVVLTIGWVLLCLAAPSGTAPRRVRGFVIGSLLIAACGFAVGLLAYVDRGWAAMLLRYYWFRLADVAVPLGVALEAAAFAGSLWAARGTIAAAWPKGRPRPGRRWLIAFIVLAAAHAGDMASLRPFPQVPRADKLPHYETWRDVCDWIAAAPEISPRARFLTPRQAHTFKWYTGRAEVVNWKEIPQDAKAIVEWQRRLNEIYGTVDTEGHPAVFDWPDELTPKKIEQLSKQYDFQYIITAHRVRMPFKRLYENQRYAVYKITKRK